MKPYQSHKKHGTNYSFLTLQREQKELEKFKKLEKDIDIMRKLRYTKYRSDEHENMKYT